MEPRQKKRRRTSTVQTEDDLERSVRRTKQKVREIVLCNVFDFFVTFTFKPGVNNEQRLVKMSTWLKNQNKNSSFKYLIVPELHKSGLLHFHALLKNYQGNIVDSGIKRYGKTVYNIKSYRNGFTTGVKISPGDSRRVGHYVAKYITKDMPRFPGKKRYWRSSNLKKPVKIENSEPWFDEIKPSAELSNLWGRIMYFSIGRKYES